MRYPAEVRIALYAPGGDEPVSSVFADRLDAGTFELRHDYPDLSPQPGWRLEAAGVVYEITAASGRTLTVEE